MLILRDWSSAISLDHKEIDEERGVISEELRGSFNGEGKAQEFTFSKLGNETIYSKRNIIGTLEGLKNFTYDDIKDFYKTWYRPANQAIIIVGDFDIDQMEAKVKELYRPIPTG